MVEYTITYRETVDDHWRVHGSLPSIAATMIEALWIWDDGLTHQVQVRDLAGKLVWHAGPLDGCPETALEHPRLPEPYIPWYVP